MVNVQNGIQVLALGALIILALIVCMTVLAITGNTIPSAFPDALGILVAGLVGGAAVHAMTPNKQSPPPSPAAPPPAAPAGPSGPSS